jgi:hypothetical protein
MSNKPFPQHPGVKQEDNLAPTLFVCVIQAVLDSLNTFWSIPTVTFKWHPPTRNNTQRGHLTTANSKNKGSPFTINKILYADNLATIFLLDSEITDGSKMLITHFTNFGLTAHIGKIDTYGKKGKSKSIAMFIPVTNNNPPSGPDRDAILLQNNKFIPYADTFLLSRLHNIIGPKR